MKSFRKITFKSFLEYLTAFLIILDCNTVYFCSLPNRTLLYGIDILSLLLLCYVSGKHQHNINIQKKIMLFFLFYIINALIMLMNMDSSAQMGFIARFVIFLPLMIYYFALQKNGEFIILERYSNLLCLLGIASIVLFYLGPVFNIIPPLGNIILNWEEVKLVSNYYYLCFDSQSMRNCGIFAEVPMYNFCLCIALLYEVFLSRTFNIIKILVLVITILTTSSTTGLLVLLVTFVLFMSNSSFSKRKFNPILKCFLFIGVFCIAILAYNYSKDIIAEKQQTESYDVRMYYLKKQMSAWQKHPIFGNGFQSSATGSSNSIATILADGGIHFFLLFAFAFLIIPLYARTPVSKVKFLYWSFMLFIIFCFTIIFTTLPNLMVMALSLSTFIRKK